MPTGFVIRTIETNWDHPVSWCPIDANRTLVAEKPGRVWYLENDAKKNLVLDINMNVLNLLDRGLLECAIDPHFDQNGYIYLLYAVDPNADGIDNEKESYCRLERWTLHYDANGNLIADPNSAFDLLGDVWTTGMPACYYSHSVGTIRFLSDGSMVLTSGDAAHYDNVDIGGQEPNCFGPGKFTVDQDWGSFRAQYPNTLAGKVIRIDPATGLGLPDNPWFDGNPGSIISRTYARGLRNPFRFNLMPGTGPRETLFICDVGWNTWEELNVCKGGENFGWPCIEGPGPSPYFSVDPNNFCTNLAATAPLLTWNHSSNGSLGFKGNCASGAAFYKGTSYPPLYQNTLFFCDYGQSWLKCLRLDANNQITSILPFGTIMNHPIDLQTDPGTGDLVYISFEGNGEIRRIQYLGVNKPPVLNATVAPQWGAAPLVVNCDASASSDPEGGSLTFAWDFGDGTNSTASTVSHNYALSQNSTITLTITDNVGYTATQQYLISPNNTPPTIASINSPSNGYVFTSGVPFSLDVTATDVENAAAGHPVAVKWVADLLHDHHTHPGFSEVDTAVGSMTLASQGPGTYFALNVLATDDRGLTATNTLYLYDSAATPEPFLNSIDTDIIRLGRPVGANGEVEYPNTQIGWAKPTLVWDWGDGTQTTFPNVAHQQQTKPTHLYAQTGNYTITLTAKLGSFTSSITTPVKVVKPKPAVAVFTPLVNSGFIPWDQQESIAQQVHDAMVAKGTEAHVFAFDQQQELVDWMTPYLDDGVCDVLIVLDTIPSKLFSGQDNGSLAELWLQHGNAIVWTGNEPFTEYVQPDGKVTNGGAGADGSDRVLNAPLGCFVCRGSGSMAPTPIGALQIPALPFYFANFSLRYYYLPMDQWKVGTFYERNTGDFDSDDILVRHASGGFYAQFMCSAAPNLPRAQVLLQFLDTYASVKRMPPVH